MLWFLIFCFFAAFFLFVLWSLKPKPLPGIPHPDGYSIIFGDLLTIKKNIHRFLDWHVEVSRKTNKTWQITVPGRQNNLKISNPECIKHILKTNIKNYEKIRVPFDNRIFYELTGNKGLLMLCGEEWRAVRKPVTHLFTSNVLSKHMTSVFIKNAQRVHNILAKLDEESIDVQDIFFRYTMDSFSEIAFGDSLDGLLQEEEPEFSIAFDRIQHRCVLRRIEPEFLFKLKLMFGSSDEKQMAKDHAVVNDWAYKVIAKRRKQIDDKKYEGNIISLLLSRAEKEGKTLNDEWLRDQAVSLTLAGRDTTASILTSIFQLLSKHPDIEEKVIAEVDEVLQGELPTFESVKGLKYIECVFNEALRMFPPAPLNFRKAIKKDVLPDGTCVPVGTEVHYVNWVLGRNTELFPEPEKFKPERWLSPTDGKKKKRLPQPASFAWPAFNAGPRNCLGQKMSYLEAKISISMILQKFRLKLEAGQNLNEYSIGLTLTRKHGQLMKAIPRKDDKVCQW